MHLPLRFNSSRVVVTTSLFILILVLSTTVAAAGPGNAAPKAEFSQALAFDVSPSMSAVSARPQRMQSQGLGTQEFEIRPERGPVAPYKGHHGDGALQSESPAAAIAPPLANFEGLSNQDNFNIFGFRVNPPDPVGDVGPNHYVEMVNLAFAVYDKSGNKLLGPISVGELWAGFPVADCSDVAGDVIVLYDQFEDRWLLSQFTSIGPIYYNCVAISVTGDPTGPYYRYAFSAGPFFPDYPKYGVWKKSYVLTSRDFGPTVEYGISVYALEKIR